MADYVSEIMRGMPAVSGDDVGFESEIQGLVNVGALTEVGAQRLRQARRGGGAPVHTLSRSHSGLPSPPFERSERSTERRAPLGFTEDGTGANSFTLAAVLGSTTTMRAKVSRVAHVDRLLIVPSAPGATIESIKVGDEEQVLASGVPVELYGPTALTDTVPDNFSPIGPGLDFIVTLRNTTATLITGTIGTKAACKR